MQIHVYTTFVMFNCTAEESGYGEEGVGVGGGNGVGRSGYGEEGVVWEEWLWGGGSGCGEEGVGLGRREWLRREKIWWDVGREM